MKTWFLFLAVIVVMGFPASVWAAPQEPGSALSLQPIVHILHTQKQDKGNLTYIHSSDSLGTVIGPHLILTHNHFGATFGTLPDETLDISDSTGKSFRACVADVKRITIDLGARCCSNSQHDRSDCPAARRPGRDQSPHGGCLADRELLGQCQSAADHQGLSTPPDGERDCHAGGSPTHYQSG